jgi:glycerol-3-phosphate O-acyltransferase
MSMVLPLTHLVKTIFSQFSILFRTGRFPNPYQSGFYKRAIGEGTTSLIFLVDPKGFIRHFIHAEKDNLQFLMELQKGMDRPIFVVPQLVLYKKTPEKDYSTLADIFFGYRDNPGFLRKALLFFRHNRQAFIDFGQPLNLKAYLESQPSTRSFHDMTLELREMLIESIDKQKRVILGPILKSRQQLKEIVLMDGRVSERIKGMASKNEKKLRSLRKKAGEYFDEIAADYNNTTIRCFHVALTWLWKKLFEGIEVDMAGLARVREWARKGPLIYVPSHKSHIDYLILNYVLYNNHMALPRIAAGKNLAFWPVGPIFRKSGAFFIRRSFRFRGAKIYAEVINRYVKALVQEGYPIEFFIEGGRSRNGKLVLPKTGFLSLLLQAHRDGFCSDLIFIPTSISYDRIMEEKSYLKEIGGASKEKETFGQVLKARRLLKKRYGKIYIEFNHPFSLSEYLSRTDHSGKPIDWDLAFKLIQSINAVSVVTPLSLIATSILSNHRRGFQLPDLIETFDTLLAFLKRYDARVAATLVNPSKVVEETLSVLISWKVVDFLEDTEGQEDTFYYVDDDKKVELEYYKNSIIHFFIPHAFVAISLLAGSEEVKHPGSLVSDYIFLKHLFKNEFVFEEGEDAHEKVISLVDYFLGCSFLEKSEGNRGYKITKLGFDKLPIWAALAKTFVESYWIAAKSMGQAQKIKEGKSGDPVKTADDFGKRLYKLGVIDHIGSLSQINYKNAISLIKETILNASGDSDDPACTLERISELSKKLYEFSHYRA